MDLSKQNQLRYGIATRPNNGVLLKPGTKRFGRFKGDAQHEKAGLTWPQV